MQYIVLGSGAIGCYIGGRLAAAGSKVTLVGRPSSIDALTTNGLAVSDLDGFQIHLPPTQLTLSTSFANAWQSSMAELTDTVVLLCVKGSATEQAAQEMTAVCPVGAAVVSLQNGVDNVARIQAVAPHLQVIAGMVPYNVRLTNAHAVHRASSGTLYMGQCAVTEKLTRPFAQAGLPLLLTGDMLGVQWGKLLLNLNNPINALSNLPLRDELLDRDFRFVLAALQDEALAQLARAGINPAKVAAAPPHWLPHILRLPNWLFVRIAARMLQIDATARSSMWEDLQQQRTTEIDDLCGAVVRLAARNGSHAPVNQALCALVHNFRSSPQWNGPAMRQALQIA